MLWLCILRLVRKKFGRAGIGTSDRWSPVDDEYWLVKRRAVLENEVVFPASS
jgi:hypothetical protein